MIDEVSKYLDLLESNNLNDSYEKRINEYFNFNYFRFIKRNYKIKDDEEIKLIIKNLETFSLTKEEKLKIINFKPSNAIELSLV